MKETLQQAKQVRGSILIVEDEAKMRRLLELNLGEDGFTTHSAEDAETGLKLLRDNPIDLVLTDLKLPGMNGLEFLQAVKRQNAALPVIVMTGHADVPLAALLTLKTELLGGGGRVRLVARPKNTKTLLASLEAEGFTRFAFVDARVGGVAQLELRALGS